MDRSAQFEADDRGQRRRRVHHVRRRPLLVEPAQPADGAVLSRHHRRSGALPRLWLATGQLGDAAAQHRLRGCHLVEGLRRARWRRERLHRHLAEAAAPGLRRRHRHRRSAMAGSSPGIPRPARSATSPCGPKSWAWAPAPTRSNTAFSGRSRSRSRRTTTTPVHLLAISSIGRPTTARAGRPSVRI